MSSVDDRVVQMKFDNKQFEAAAATTLSTLDKLRHSMEFPNSAKGFSGLTAAAGKFDLGPVHTAIDSINAKFLAMSAIGITALTQITSKAIQSGQAIASALTIGPIGEGFSDYNLKLTSVKTVVNSTGQSLEKVNGFFDQLDEYADKTVFNLSDMTSAFAKFTNAGVGMETSIPAIKGIANMVALAGQGAGEAQIAFYNLSQSIGKGFLDTQDFKSLNLANVATKEWRENMVKGAVQAGTLKKVGKDAFKIVGGETKGAVNTQELFNDKLSEGWASAEVLTKVLGDYGDTTTKIGKKAQAAAQDVKSLPMMFDTLKASVGTGWTESFELILGNVDESTAMFTDFTTSIQGVLDTWSSSRNTMLTDWKEAGGRAAGIEAIKAAFEALGSVIGPIKEAWRDIFPATTGKQLAETTKTIRDFFKNIKMGPEQMDLLKRTFKGLFAILDVGKQILGGVFSVFGRLFSSAGKAGGGLLEFTAKVGDMLVKFDEWLKKSGGIEKFFDGLAAVIQVPIALIGALGSALSGLFGGDEVAKAGDAFGGLGEKLTPLQKILDGVVTAWDNFVAALKRNLPFFEHLGDGVGEGVSGIADTIREKLSNINWDAVFKGALVGIGAIFAGGFWKLVKDGLKINIGGSLFESLASSMDTLAGTLKTYQTQIKAKTLLLIASAILVLAVAVKLLSTIDPGSLGAAVGAMAAMFAELLITMKMLDKMTQSKGFIKIPFIATSFILLGVAMIVMAEAVKRLSEMDFGAMAQGLLGLAGVLSVVSVTMKPLAAQSSSMFSVGAGLILLGVALGLIINAMERFAGMDWGAMGKGMAGLAGVMVILGVTLAAFPTKGMFVTGAGLVLVAYALNIMADAVLKFSKIDAGELAKGILALGATLVVVAGALRLMPPGFLTQASLLLVAQALTKVSEIIAVMGNMDLAKLIQGMMGFSYMLGILAAALYLMTGTQSGALALIVTAGALIIFTQVLQTLGEMELSQLAIGLGAIAAVIVLLAAAAILLAPALPAMLVLGSALTLVGAGLALMGLAALAFAKAFEIVVNIFKMGVPLLDQIVQNFITMIPRFMTALGLAIIQFLDMLIRLSPKINETIFTMLSNLIDTIVKLIPKVLQAIKVFIKALLDLIVWYYPTFIEAGADLIINIMDGLAKKIPKLAEKATDLAIAFMKALGDNYYRFIDAGGELIVQIMDGSRKWIDENLPRIEEAGRLLAGAIINGMTFGIAGKAIEVGNALGDMAHNAIGIVQGIFKIESPSKVFKKIGQMLMAGLVIGIAQGKDDVINTITDISTEIRDIMANSAQDVKTLKERLKGLRDNADTEKNRKAIKKTQKALKAAQDVNERATKANELFTKGMVKQRGALVKLGAQYDVITGKLEQAREKLKNAIADRDQFKQSITDSFDDLPDINEETTLDSYFDNIRKSTEANKKFLATLDALRDLGLDDTSYRKFLEQGTSAQPFLDSLLDSGKLTIDELNKIDAELAKSAAGLGQTASQELYQAGVDSAQGIVDGLEAQMATIVAKMTTIGKAMADAIKKELGIKSPSRVFQQVSKDSVDGLVLGFEKYGNVVDLAAARIGKNAVESLQESLSGLGEAMGTDVDMTPVIAPVLDLDAFRKDAQAMKDILAAEGVLPTTSTNSSRVISATDQQVKDEQKAADAQQALVLQFTQNNNSPKALSTAEIYRQTNNQLSKVKEALPK